VFSKSLKFLTKTFGTRSIDCDFQTNLVHVEDEIEFADIFEALVQGLNENLNLWNKKNVEKKSNID
jgi:hypothetical protein